MKNILTIILLGMLGLTSCKKTTACIESDIAIAKLGQDITFHNCSIKYDEAEFILGDNLNTYDQYDFDSDALTASYHTPGIFTSKMEVSKGNKEDNETLTIEIEKPTIEELVGDWEYYKVEDVFIFNDSQNTTGTLTLTESTFVDVDGNTGSWTLLSNGRINLDGESFEIYRLYDGELVLRENDGFSYLYHYYVK